MLADIFPPQWRVPHCQAGSAFLPHRATSSCVFAARPGSSPITTDTRPDERAARAGEMREQRRGSPHMGAGAGRR